MNKCPRKADIVNPAGALLGAARTTIPRVADTAWQPSLHVGLLEAFGIHHHKPLLIRQVAHVRQARHHLASLRHRVKVGDCGNSTTWGGGIKYWRNVDQRRPLDTT
eukprot:6569863-Prymnesium_polylepis.1